MAVPTLRIARADTHRAKRALVIRSGATINQHADLKTTDSIHHGHIIFSYTSPAPNREDWLKRCVGIHFFLQENQMLFWVWWFHLIIKSKHCCCWFHYPVVKFCFSSVKPDHPEGVRRYNLFFFKNHTLTLTNPFWLKPNRVWMGPSCRTTPVWPHSGRYWLFAALTVVRFMADSDTDGLVTSCWWSVTGVIAVCSLAVCSAVLHARLPSVSSQIWHPSLVCLTQNSKQPCKISADYRSASVILLIMVQNFIK